MWSRNGRLSKEAPIGRARRVVKETISGIAHPRRSLRRVRTFSRGYKTKQLRRRQYLNWYQQQQSLGTTEEQAQVIKELALKPLVSIILPTYNTPEAYLRDCIESVLSQTYSQWELCIADDASTHSATKRVIKEYAKAHKNIKVVFSDKNQHIALTSNLALELARGEYMALLDHDDLLMPNALFEMVKKINQEPEADLIYSDEDKLEKDRAHVEPFFKPDWSPDFLLSCNYITHFALMSRKIIDKVGGFRAGTEGAQDWDLFLRIAAQTSEIHHVPKILYTWRKSPTSTAQTAKSKPYAYLNQKQTVRYALAERQLPAGVGSHPALGFWQVRYEIQGLPLVSIIIPTKDQYRYIKRCLESIFTETSYPYFEVIIVDTGSTDPKVKKFYRDLLAIRPNVRVVNRHESFNFSAACNLGAGHAKGEYFLFLNNDTKVISGRWIQTLLGHAQLPEVGMVGAKLLFPNGTIQHAGVVLSNDDIAFHPFYGLNVETDIFSYIYTDNIRNVAAVTAACAMVARDKFDKVKGFDEGLRVTYNDVDLCLKLLKAGYRNVYNPFAKLIHYESVSVGRITTAKRDMGEQQAAADLMRKRWGELLTHDPYYNPNFIPSGPGYYLTD